MIVLMAIAAFAASVLPAVEIKPENLDATIVSFYYRDWKFDGSEGVRIVYRLNSLKPFRMVHVRLLPGVPDNWEVLQVISFGNPECIDGAGELGRKGLFCEGDSSTERHWVGSVFEKAETHYIRVDLHAANGKREHLRGINPLVKLYVSHRTDQR